MAEPDVEPIRIALIDDYDVVLTGLASMLAPFGDRVRVVEIDANRPLDSDVDIALCDSFAQIAIDFVDVLVRSPHARRVAIYTWDFRPDLIDAALRRGVTGYLSKALRANDLVTALESIHSGRTTISDAPQHGVRRVHADWPGRREGLSEREAEVLALITQGKNNAEIAQAAYLSPNTVKSYIRNLYRKVGVHSRTQAALWGVTHGFAPNHDRISPWRNTH